MPYKSADERFKLADQCLNDVRVLAENMQEIGCYSAQEEAAFKLVVFSLVRAMGILDPEASERLAEERMAEFVEKETEPPTLQGLGQYL